MILTNLISSFHKRLCSSLGTSS